MDDQQPLVVNNDETDVDIVKTDKCCTKYCAGCSVRCRYTLVIMMFLGFFSAFAQRMVFNIALVAMVNLTQSTVNETSHDCPAEPVPLNTTNASPTGGFNWNADLQSLMLGAFFYGYPLSQLPGGYLAERFGGRYLMAFVGLSSSVLSLLVPVVAGWSPYGLLALRALQGLCQGPLYPICIAMWSRWAPPNERNKMYGIVNSGATFGCVIAMVAAGPLCQSTFLGGWPSVFYLFGGLGVLLAVAWTVLIHDTPAVHPRITPAERAYIEEATEGLDTVKYSNPPLLSILRSPPVWAVLILLCTDGFGFYVTFSCMPLYMRQVLRFDMSQDGMMSALPYLVQFPCSILVGFASDTVRRKAWLRTVNIRRVAVFFGEMMPGVFLVLLGFVGCNKIAAVSMLVLSLGVNALVLAGPAPALFDIAPLYAGSLMGILNGISNVAGIIAPLAVAKLTGDSPDQSKWKSVFYLSAGTYAFGTIIFCLLISDKEQKWAKDRRDISESGESEETSSPIEIQT